MGLAIIFFDYTVIFASCIVGSYLAIRGISQIIGGFPNEFLIYEALVNQKFMAQQGSFFLYVLLMILLAVFTIQRQLRKRRENLEIYSYKRFDFRYRRLSKDGNDAKTLLAQSGSYEPVQDLEEEDVD